MQGLIASTTVENEVDIGLREVGRFGPGSKAMPALAGKEFASSSLAKMIKDYVVNRQNDDGGYTFVQTAESNAQDTYYGLAILHLLNALFPNVERTATWLQGFVPESLYHHYYVAKALILCGENPNGKLKGFLLSRMSSKEHFGTVDVYVEAASEFVTTFMVTELVNIAGVPIDREKATKWLLSYKNKDGGFGAKGYSSLSSTFHAIVSLFSLGYPVNSLRETLVYVRSCEKPAGFTIVPRSRLPYMEHVYHGVLTLELLSEHVKYPENVAKFVLSCHKANGGFGRADLGIATFEDTFFAVTILRKIGKL